MFPPPLLRGGLVQSTDTSLCPTKFIIFEGKLTKHADFQTPGETAWRRKEFSAFTIAQLTLSYMYKCWCTSEIISFLQFNKNRNTTIWLAYLSWVEIKQLPKEVANLTRQMQRWLRFPFVTYKCKSGYLTADEQLLVLLRCLSKVSTKWADQGCLPASQEAGDPGAGFGAGSSQAAIPLGQSSSRELTRKAGHTRGTHQLVQLSIY